MIAVRCAFRVKSDFTFQHCMALTAMLYVITWHTPHPSRPPTPLSFLSQAHMHTKFAPWLWVRILIMNIPENVWKPSARQALSALGSLRQCDIHDKPIWGKCFEEIAHNLLLSGNRPFNNLFDYLCWVLYLMKETVSISKDSIYCSQLFNDAILVKVLHVSLSITFGRRSSSWQP